MADFHPQNNSPCIDSGSNTAPSLPELDGDGNRRVAFGAPDMGAYEVQARFRLEQTGPQTAVLVLESYVRTMGGQLAFLYDSGVLGCIELVEGPDFPPGDGFVLWREEPAPAGCSPDLDRAVIAG